MQRMAAAAMHKRDSTAAKLRDSVRQMRRYLDGHLHSERIIVHKCDKIDLDREELIAKHHQYAEKASLSLEEEEMQNYIEPKIDQAVDIVDEATLLIERLNSDAKREIEDSHKDSKNQRDKLEIVSAKLQADSNEKLILQTLVELDNLLLTVDPSYDHANMADMYLIEIQKKEEELIKSWNTVKSRLTDEDEIVQMVGREEVLLAQITRKRIKGKLFVSKIKVEEISEAESGSDARTVVSNVKLQRMKPPRFSGNIRDYARFKADFDKIVKSSYTDPVHQVYIMKENCLQGEAHDLVRNLDIVGALTSICSTVFDQI